VKYGAVTLICVLSLCGLLSCGLEEFYYIDYIPQGDYTLSNAVINLPSRGYEGYTAYFENFIIFYRIYISGGTQVQTGDNLRTNSTDRSAINTALNSHYTYFSSFTDITSTAPNTSNLETTFGSRGYYVLNLENNNINNVLGSGSLGSRLEIAFPPNPGQEPTLTINNGDPHKLRRARAAPAGQSSVIFSPRPNWNLLNSSVLYNNDNITLGNTDTEAYSVDTPRYTYISMYIAAKGSGGMPPLPIFSQPTFIGIFRLADSG